MHGMFQLGPSRGATNLADLQAHLEKLPGITDVVVRQDGRIFMDYTPERFGEQQIVKHLRKLGLRVVREAKAPEGITQTEPMGLSAPGPGDTQLSPMASSVRDAELSAYHDVEQAEEGEANQAKFPGHSTA